MILILKLAITPVVIGLLSFAFSKTLMVTSTFSLDHSNIIYLLPLTGMFLTWWNSAAQRQLPKLHELNLHISNQKATNPWCFLYVFIWTQLSHFVGASVGRESPATVMGLAVAKMMKGNSVKHLSHWKRHFWTELFLRVGIASGFSAVFGVPLAGTFFALAISPLWRWPIFTVLACSLSSYLAYLVAHYFKIPHNIYPQLLEITVSPESLIFIWLSVFLIGGLYLKSKEFLSQLLLKILSPLWRGFVVGLGLQFSIMFLGLGYASMSLDTLQTSFLQTSDLWFFAGKGTVTLLSQLAQFAGGEVTPLMTTASTLGNSIVQFWQLPIPFAWSGSIAIVTFLTLLLETPLAMAFLGCELFGWNGFFVFAIAAYLTYVSKVILWKKTHPRYPLNLPKN